MPIENRPDNQPNQIQQMQILHSRIDSFLQDEGPPFFREEILEEIQDFIYSLRRKARILQDVIPEELGGEVKLKGLSSVSIRELDEPFLRFKEVIAKNRLFDQEAEIDVGISSNLFYIWKCSEDILTH